MRASRIETKSRAVIEEQRMDPNTYPRCAQYLDASGSKEAMGGGRTGDV